MTPLTFCGKPPEKSNWTSPLVRAPASCGPKISNPSSDCRRVAPKLLCDPPRASVGKSWLSTSPRLLNRLNRTIPESRTRYFDALSILVWCCSSTLPFNSCVSSSTLEMRSSSTVGLVVSGPVPSFTADASLVCVAAGEFDARLPVASRRFCVARNSSRSAAVSIRYWAASDRISVTASRN